MDSIVKDNLFIQYTVKLVKLLVIFALVGMVITLTAKYLFYAVALLVLGIAIIAALVIFGRFLLGLLGLVFIIASIIFGISMLGYIGSLLS